MWCSCVVARDVRSPSWMLKSQQLQCRERDKFVRPGVLLRTSVRMAIRPQLLYQHRHPQIRVYGRWYLCVGSHRNESCTPCRAAFALLLWLKTGGLAGFALGSNKIANSSNTTVYVGVTIFALCGLVVGHMITVASSTFLCSTQLCTLASPSLPCPSCRRVDRLEANRFLLDRSRERHVSPLTQGACWLCPEDQHDS